MIDEAKSIRAGEDIDSPALRAFLADALQSTDIELSQFRGGHSNLTYLLKSGTREFVLRRPPFGTQVKTAHDMEREYRVLAALSKAWPKAPKPAALCTDSTIMGCHFYLMERRRGLILRSKVPEDVSLGESKAARLCESFVGTLAELHGFSLDELGLGDFGKPQGYIERQVGGWSKRYSSAQTDDIPDVDSVARWLAENRPGDKHPALIHNDYKFDNVVLNPDALGDITALLDWEMSTVGDARMDLGTALCYWIEKDDPAPMHMLPFGPTKLPGMLTRNELCERYQERAGIDVESPVFFYAFGLFKTAVVAQQIYFRFKSGKTSDPRFAQMLPGVRILTAAAARAIESGSL